MFSRLGSKTAVLALVGAVVVASCSSAATGTGSSSSAGSGGTLVVGLTGNALPNPDTLIGGDGWEGARFVGKQLYDSLVRQDLTHEDRSPEIVPSLATSWQHDKTGTVWTFKLRQGVKFHDGTALDAAAVAFNFDRYLNEKNPYHSDAMAGSVWLYASFIKQVRALTADSVEVTTKRVDGHLLNDLTNIPIGSPAAVKSEGSAGFAKHPIGSGPFKFVSQNSEQLVLERNPDYWNGPAKLDKLILKPISDAAARTAALRAGGVNWIEYPNPDDVPGLKDQGFSIHSNSYDHLWYILLDQKKKPWNDVRVRLAANLAIDRESIAKDLLHGTADPAYQVAPWGTPGYDPANDKYRYDPAEAKRLLAAAGLPNGFATTFVIPTAGSGNLIPVQIAEKIQQDLAQVGIKVTLKTGDFDSLLSDLSAGKVAQGADAQAGSTPVFLSEVIFGLSVKSDSPWFHGNPTGQSVKTVDQLVVDASRSFDAAKVKSDYVGVAKAITDDAWWLTVVNDRNPRALAPNVHGLVQAQSWFLDLRSVWVGN